MTRWLALLSALWLSSASAFGGLNPFGSLPIAGQQAGSLESLPNAGQQAGSLGSLPIAGQQAGSLGSLPNAGQQAGSLGSLPVAGQQVGPLGSVPIVGRQLNMYGGGIVGSITKEVVAIKDPVDKTVVLVGFSQCQNVKKLLGVDYGQYVAEPDYTQLSLNFITNEIKSQLNLTALSALSYSKWFKPSEGLIIYLHGFTDDPTKNSYTNINTALLQQGFGNVLALDASSLIRWLYLRSSTMVRFIGEQLGQALVKMMQAGLNPSSIHLVGHSLGAHIAGFTGKTVLELTGYRVGRITGLDPAGPCFANVDVALRLNANDASYVDVIHTDAGVYGLNERAGHADYYPNRGSEQPNCVLQTCSHSRAWELYAESLSNPKGFPAVSCSSWKAFQDGTCDYTNYSLMGYASRPGTVGQFYLQTADSSPYALGVNGISHKNNDGIIRSIRDHIGLWK